jgi:hypothetical protein
MAGEGRSAVDKMTFIYALRDPRSRARRYIGKSIDPKARQRQYCSPAECRHHKSHCSSWCLHLLARGLRPVLEILEVCPPGSPWWLREQYWIAEGRRLGWYLTNHSAGGEAGGLGVKRSAEFRRRVSRAMRGRPKSRTTRRRMSLGCLGRPVSADAKAAIGNANRGRSPSAATREKLRQAQMGKTLSPEARTKVSMAQRARDRSDWEIERLRWHGRHMSDETRRRMAAAKLGRKLPMAVRRKMSESHKRLAMT